MKLTLTEDMRVIDVESVSQRCVGVIEGNNDVGYSFKTTRVCGLPVRLTEDEQIEVCYLLAELEG